MAKKSIRQFPPITQAPFIAIAPQYWNKFFRVEQFEKDKNGEAYIRFRSFSTNGIAASLTLDKLVVENAPCQRATMFPHHLDVFNALRNPIPKFDAIVGLDPGVRLVVGGLRLMSNVENQRELIKKKSRVLHYSNGHFARRKELQRWIKPVERDIFHQLQQLDEDDKISPKSSDYIRYTHFHLSFFLRKIKIYTDHRITRHRFDFYIRRERAIDLFLDEEICPRGISTLIFYGGARQAANSPIRGYIKPPQQRIYNALMRRDDVVVLLTDEFRTTKCCSNCFHSFRAVKYAKDRNKYCENCGASWNRDVNAGRNIIIRGLSQYFSNLGHGMPLGLLREYVHGIDERDPAFEVLDEVEEMMEEEDGLFALDDSDYESDSSVDSD